MHEIRQHFRDLKIYRKGDERAPHKPLLALYALGQLDQGKGRLISFKEIDRRVGELLENFGPPRKTQALYPFWRMQGDHVWEVEKAEELPVSHSGDPKKTDLLRQQIRGGFPEPIFNALKNNPKLLKAVAQELLEKHFPVSIHDDILQAIGIDLATDAGIVQRRNPEFRNRVLRAYEYRCAICGFDIRIDHTPIGLEAAHIKWHTAGGPDEESNGLALCTLHHKLFDRGAFTLSKRLEVLVSDRANGAASFNDWLLRYHGKRLSPPQRQTYQPNMAFRDWHVREVFRGEVRELKEMATHPSCGYGHR